MCKTSELRCENRARCAPELRRLFRQPADESFGWAGADYGVWGKAVLDAMDYQTGEIRWSHEPGPNGTGAAVLTTDSGLIFAGDAQGNEFALRTGDGRTLWHAGAGSPIQSSPITMR